MPKSSEEQAQARRDEIVNACAELYETMSFRDITLKEIGQRTSFTRTSIYNYFETREEIFLALTQREYELIKFLAAQPGKVFSREALMENVWNYEGYVGDVRAVDVAIRRLREKVEDDPASPQFVVTRRGLGYYFNA